MASGTTSVVSSGKLDGRISWSSTADKTNNQSTVTLTLQAKKNTGTQATSGKWTGSTKIENTSASFSTKNVGVGTSSWVNLATQTLVVKHNDNGSKSTAISGTINAPSGTSMAGTKVTINATAVLDTIPRYFTKTPVITVQSRTHNSIVFGWTTSENCSQVSITSGVTTGITHIETIDSTKKKGTVTFNGLEAGKTYTFGASFKRADSGLSTSVSLQGNTVSNPVVQSVSSSDGYVTYGSTINIVLLNEMRENVNVYIKKDSLSGYLFEQINTSADNISVQIDNEKLYRSLIADDGSLVNGGNGTLAIFTDYNTAAIPISYGVRYPDVGSFKFYRAAAAMDTLNNELIRGLYCGNYIPSAGLTVQYRYKQEDGNWSQYVTVPSSSITLDQDNGIFEIAKDAITLSNIDYTKLTTIEMAANDSIMTVPVTSVFVVPRGKPPWWTTKDYLGTSELRTQAFQYRDTPITFMATLKGEDDLNDFKESGIYRCNGDIYFNVPSLVGWVIVMATGNNVKQVFINDDDAVLVGKYVWVRECENNTWTAWRLLNGIDCAKLKLSSTMRYTGNSFTLITLSKLFGTNDKALKFYQNGIQIGDGVSMIRVHGQIYFFTGSQHTGTKDIAIYKNGVSAARSIVRTNLDYITVEVSDIIQVEKGDYIQLYGRNNTTEKQTVIHPSATYMTVEVIG